MADFIDQLRIKQVRVSNFRSLEDVEVNLEDLTVLIGANNSGKTTFLDALQLALGLGRRLYGAEDIFIRPTESAAPRERIAIVDVVIRPTDVTGVEVDSFPSGSFWTSLWGLGISQDEKSRDFMAFRTSLAWDIGKGEYSVTRRFLKDWPEQESWLEAEEKAERITASQIEPIALHYIDAKRDLDDDLRKPGSFWRRLVDDLGLSDEEVTEFEKVLSELNASIVGKSAVLRHLRQNLTEIQNVVAADSAGIDIAPVARRLRDLSRGVDVSFSSAGSQPFPLTRHGMGTRSLASLLVFRAFVSWRAERYREEAQGEIHLSLALEEPEAHLHPQAQRALYAQVKAIKGQRIVSTHSAYFAGQADLAALRLFQKLSGSTLVKSLDTTKISAEEKHQIERRVIATRGDLLFSRALVLFEGETEEQALPIWSSVHFKASTHELGFSFVGVGGGNYFPFVWLAEQFGIKWFVFSDGESQPLKTLEAQLGKAGIKDPLKDARVFAVPKGNDLEANLVADGYSVELEQAIESVLGKGRVDEQIAKLHGMPGRRNTTRDYKSAGGRDRAILDLFRENKTAVATAAASTIAATGTESRRIPAVLRPLFERMQADLK
jgi:putative ATP-dependent endonuclease of the OLD family